MGRTIKDTNFITVINVIVKFDFYCIFLLVSLIDYLYIARDTPYKMVPGVTINYNQRFCIISDCLLLSNARGR